MVLACVSCGIYFLVGEKNTLRKGSEGIMARTFISLKSVFLVKMLPNVPFNTIMYQWSL